MRAVRLPIDRFWSHTVIEPFTGCWVWMGALVGGYGVMGKGRAGEGLVRVHRFSYEYFIGPIPSGLEPDHLCRLRCCANPLHLEPVTRQVNFLRGQHPTAINFRANLCRYGHSMDDSYKYRGARACRTCAKINYDPVARHERYISMKGLSNGLHI